MGIVNLHRTKTSENIFSFVAFQPLQTQSQHYEHKLSQGRWLLKGVGQQTLCPDSQRSQKVNWRGPFGRNHSHRHGCHTNSVSDPPLSAVHTGTHLTAPVTLWDRGTAENPQATQSSSSSGPTKHEESSFQHQRPIIKASIKSRKNSTPSVLGRKEYDLYWVY